MKTLATLALMSVVAFVGGAAGVLAMVAAAGGLLFSQGALAYGGAFDPITATLAVGLGGAALTRLRRTATEEVELTA